MFDWLTSFYFREGPGIAKDAPKPTGWRLLASVLAREWWELLKLNLLFLIFCLPLVTVPAAWFALVSITVAMIEDRNVYLLRDFWRAFRTRFALATGLGIAFAAVEALSLLALVSYANAARDHLAFVVPMVVALVVSALLPLYAGHVLVAMALKGKATLGTLARASALGLLARPLPGLGAFFFVALLWVVHVIFYPASVFMPVLVNFSLGTLAMSFAVYRGVQFGFSHLAASSQHETTGSPETQSA